MLADENYMYYLEFEAKNKIGNKITDELLGMEHGCVVSVKKSGIHRIDYMQHEITYRLFMNPVRVDEVHIQLMPPMDWKVPERPSPTEIRCQYCGQLNEFDNLECRKCGGRLYKQEEYWE
jgi:hypothetical protein